MTRDRQSHAPPGDCVAWISLALTLGLAGCGPAGERPIQGYIEGEYVRVAAPFAGALTQLSVKRGEQVSTGAPLFALERENEVALRRQAEQQLQAAQARLENLRTGKRPPEVETVAEQLRQAIATRDLAVANLDRQQKLRASGFISAAALDDARTQVKRDEAAVAQLQASVATAKLPARADEIRAADADARAAREALAQADWRLASARDRVAGDRARQRHLLCRRRLGSRRSSGSQPFAARQCESQVLRSRAGTGPDQAGADDHVHVRWLRSADVRHDLIHFRPC